MLFTFVNISLCETHTTAPVGAGSFIVKVFLGTDLLARRPVRQCSFAALHICQLGEIIKTVVVVVERVSQ